MSMYKDLFRYIESALCETRMKEFSQYSVKNRLIETFFNDANCNLFFIPAITFYDRRSYTNSTMYDLN